MNTTTIIVLNDGETYSDAEGFTAFKVDADASPEEIEEALRDLRRASEVARMVVLTDPLISVVAQWVDGKIVTHNPVEIA